MCVYTHTFTFFGLLSSGSLVQTVLNYAEKMKTHVLCSIIISENRTIYEIMWKNMVEPERPYMTL
jgi:hypothetical protein